MKKSTKKLAVRKKTEAAKSKIEIATTKQAHLAAELGVPTVAIRLDAIEAYIIATAAVCRISEEDLGSTEPRLRSVALNTERAKVVHHALSGVFDALYWLQQVEGIQHVFAPTDDQQKAIDDRASLAGGAR